MLQNTVIFKNIVLPGFALATGKIKMVDDCNHVQKLTFSRKR